MLHLRGCPVLNIKQKYEQATSATTSAWSTSYTHLFKYFGMYFPHRPRVHQREQCHPSFIVHSCARPYRLHEPVAGAATRERNSQASTHARTKMGSSLCGAFMHRQREREGGEVATYYRTHDSLRQMEPFVAARVLIITNAFRFACACCMRIFLLSLRMNALRKRKRNENGAPGIM